MDYTVNVDSMENLEKEYQEFFGKGVNTKFEEVRMAIRQFRFASTRSLSFDR